MNYSTNTLWERTNEIQSHFFGGYEDGSVSKIFALQAQELKFNYENPREQEDAGACLEGKAENRQIPGGCLPSLLGKL